MAIDYRIAQIKHPKSEKKQFYARPAHAQRVEIEELAEQISYSTTLTDVEVQGVINALIRQMQQNIAQGRIVALGKFGSFHITFNCKGVDNKEDFNIDQVKKVNLRFLPGTALKQALNMKNLKFRCKGEVPASPTV